MSKFLLPFDPLKDAEEQDSTAVKNVVHVRMFQKSARSRTTTIEGLSSGVDLKTMMSKFKQMFNTGCVVLETPEHGKVVQLQGDHRDGVIKYLIDNNIVSRERIRRHE